MNEVDAQSIGGLAFEVVDAHADAITFHRAFLLRVHTGNLLGPATEDFAFECLLPAIAEFLKVGFVGRHVGLFGHGDEDLVGGGVLLVLRNVGEHTQICLRERFGRSIEDLHGISAFEVTLKPVKRAHVDGLQVLVRSLAHLQSEGGRISAEQLVDAAHVGKDAEDTVDGEDGVLVSVHDQKRTRSRERDHAREVPAMRVHEEHAVAMSLDAAVDDLVLHVGDTGGGCAGLDALVERGDPPRVGTATAAAGDTKLRFIDLGTRFEVIERTDAAPGLEPGGRVAA